MRRIVLIGAVLFGCGGGSGSSQSGSFPAQALMSVASDSGQLNVAIRSDPQPPTRGTDQFQLTVTDGSGAPVDGLDVSVQLWMPDMGHGSSTNPTVAAKGQGVYEVSDCYLAMAGTWQLRISFAGKLSDHATASFQIP